jgi:hypothetical protein
MSIQILRATRIAILSIVVTSNVVYAPPSNPDPLTGSILEDKYHMDTSDHGPGPNHTQIN